MPEQNQKFVYPIMIDFVDRRDKTQKSLGEGLTLFFWTPKLLGDPKILSTFGRNDLLQIIHQSSKKSTESSLMNTVIFSRLPSYRLWRNVSR